MKGTDFLKRLGSIAIVLVSALSMSGNAAAAPDGYPEFEDGRVWIFGDGTAKVRTYDGVEARVKTRGIARYLHKYRKFKTTRISLRYMDGVSGLEQVQPLAEKLAKYGIKTSVAIDDYMLEHMTMPEYRRAHIIDLGGGQYRFEMNCETQEQVRYNFGDTELRSLSITGNLELMDKWIGMFDGHGVAIYPQDMPWADALSMASAAWKRGIDQVSIVYEDSSPAADISGLNDFYRMFKGENGPITITLIPQNAKIAAKADEKAVDVAARMNAAISSDWFDKGKRISNPKNQYNQNSSWLHITNVIRTNDETVLLFYSYQGNDLWLMSLSGLTLRAGGKEYKETAHDGLPGFEDRYFWSPDNGYYYFAVRFPALPDNVDTVDLIDSENGSICVRDLQVSDRKVTRDDDFNILLYGEYQLQTINIHEDAPDIVTARSAHLTPAGTTVYMEMSIMEPHSVKGHVGSDFTLSFKNGKELKALRVEGVVTDQDFDRGGDHVSNFFQVVFPATKPMDWMEGQSKIKGTICHEPIELNLVAGLQVDDIEANTILMRALGLDFKDDARSGITFKVDENLPKPKNTYIIPSITEAQRRKSLGDVYYTLNNSFIAASFWDTPIATAAVAPFFTGMVQAFADHRPVSLSPDVIWMLISQAFSHEVNAAPERFRDKFVDFDGKTDLVVQSDRRLYDPEFDWTATIDGFAQKIDEHTKGDIAKTLTADFTTTGTNERMASEIVLMETTKAYFEYIIYYIGCGIPSVTLTGTVQDWQNVLDKTTKLQEMGAGRWAQDLIPILEQFLEAAKGNPDRAFWQDMVMVNTPERLRGGACSMDKPTLLDGWFLKLLPFDKNGNRTPSKVPHTSDDFPTEMASVPAKYIEVNPMTGKIDNTVDLKISGGIAGYTADEETGCISFHIGWTVNKSDVTSLTDKLKDNPNDHITLRVSEIPEELKDIDHFSATLDLYFTGKIVIPEWLTPDKIENSLIVHGEISASEKKALQERFGDRIIFKK